MASPFLADRTPRAVSFPPKAGLANGELYVGQGQSGLEVVVAQTSTRPNAGSLHAAWKARRAGRATPILLITRYADKAAICGPAGDDPPVHFDSDPGQVSRLCHEALEQPDRHAALRFLAQALPSLETALPGICNEGLLALHELTYGAPRRKDWQHAGFKARGVIGRQNGDLLSALGFQVERLDNLTRLLRARDRRTALAVLLEQSESPEAAAARFNSISPAGLFSSAGMKGALSQYESERGSLI